VKDIRLDKVGAAYAEVEDWKTSSQATASKAYIADARPETRKPEK
jgi:hypothetical protein